MLNKHNRKDGEHSRLFRSTIPKTHTALRLETRSIMCEGAVTLLRCPHLLVHFATRCGRNCELPNGPRFELGDTCAACHPSYRVHVINVKHELERAELMAQLRLAVEEKRTQDQRDITHRLTLAQNQCIQDVIAAKRLRTPLEGVIWPGKTEDW